MSEGRELRSTGRLAGRRIVISGGASGIGAATAQRLSAEGAHVFVLDKDLAGATSVAAACGGTALAVDVQNACVVHDVIDRAAAQLGGIDGIVNVAGINTSVPFEQTDAAIWQRTLDVNLTGSYHVCHAALPYLRQSGAATIVNTSSAVALQPLANRTAYAASKGGLVAFSKALAVELAPKIRVNVICPGAVDTPFVHSTFTDPAALVRIANMYAMKRMGSASEIAEAILFLTSHESSFVTGATIAIDGGRTYH